MPAPKVIPLDSTAFARTHAAFDTHLGSSGIPGAVVGVWSARDPGVIGVMAAGQRRVVPSALPMQTDTLFDLSSVSKIVATAPLAAALVERGWLRWDSRVAPWLKAGGPTVAELLSHTAGFVAWAPLWKDMRGALAPGDGVPSRLGEVSFAERRKFAQSWVRTLRPEAPAGERVVYSDLSMLILGLGLEELLGEPFEGLVQRWVWGPLELSGLHYRAADRTPEAAAQLPGADLCAATEDCPWRGGVLQGQVHDDNTWAMGGIAPHSGVFGTAADVVAFGVRLLGGFFSHAVTHAMWARVESPAGCERTPGWDTPSGERPSCGRHFSRQATVGHLGFTGTSLWIDRMRGVVVSLLTNRVHPTREGGSQEKIRAFRPELHDAVMEDLGLA